MHEYLSRVKIEEEIEEEVDDKEECAQSIWMQSSFSTFYIFFFKRLKPVCYIAKYIYLYNFFFLIAK